MKRIITFLLILLTTVSAHAVLKEKNLDQTLQILRTELTEYHRELSERLQKNQKQSEQLRNQLISILKRSNQNSLMLYSQKQEYVFDLTYACHEATELYQEFHRQQLPFKLYMSKADTEIARYDSLITSLSAMPHQYPQLLGRKQENTGRVYLHLRQYRTASWPPERLRTETL